MVSQIIYRNRPAPGILCLIEKIANIYITSGPFVSALNILTHLILPKNEVTLSFSFDR